MTELDYDADYDSVEEILELTKLSLDSLHDFMSSEPNLYTDADLKVNYGEQCASKTD